MIFEIGDLISKQKDVQTEEIFTGFAKSLTLTILDYHRKAQQSEATVDLDRNAKISHQLGGKETQVNNDSVKFIN